MNVFFQRYLKGDIVLWIVFFGLCIVSVVELYSASSTLAYAAARRGESMPILQHVVFLAGGAVVALLIHGIPSKYIRMLSYPALLAAFLLQLLTPFIGITINGARRWVRVPGLGITVQPSEFVKIALIIVVADLISRIKTDDEQKRLYAIIMCILGLSCLTIFPSNLSTALMLFLVSWVMMFMGGISWKRLCTPLLILAIGAVSGYFVVKNLPSESMPAPLQRAYTWTNRIDRFFDGNDEADKYNLQKGEYQVKVGKVAIAHGGFLGVGPGNSVERDVLPIAYADSIFAIVVEELGLWGACGVILLYLILLFRAGYIAQKCSTAYPALLVTGLALMLVLQAFVSMAVVLGMGPSTGQPLPLISNGGTAIVTTCVYFGIILGIAREQREREDKEANVKSESESNIPVIDMEKL